ncbi:MAG: radical SAM protein [Sphaerochaetaceae bacterium]|nr:radical SAM protein [Sphaerochaetaceae bacterium]
MDIRDSMGILARDAQYDLSCACGTKNPAEHRTRKNSESWLYPVTVAEGGSGIMLKTLLSNSCSNDCLYCPLRESQDTRRTSVSPDDLARFFIDMLSHRKLIGIFLSSGVIGTAEFAMDRLIATSEILRNRYHYRGYIHTKIIPGASSEAIRTALRYASAVSLNIETPGERHFARLSTSKRYAEDIIGSLRLISDLTGPAGPFSRVHTTSQFIVGASDESDREILSYTKRMYDKLNFDRLYFSAYQGGLGDPSIPGEIHYRTALEREFSLSWQEESPTLMREHRLYQADFLFRQYGFTFNDLSFTPTGALDLSRDPKQVWADRNPQFFPVSVKRASSKDLMRVPGIGPVTARRIVALRKESSLSDITQLPLTRSLYRKAAHYLTL